MTRDKPGDLADAQRRMVEFYLSARNCRGKANPDLLEAKMESARWWMAVVEDYRHRCVVERPLAPGGFRLSIIENYG